MDPGEFLTLETEILQSIAESLRQIAQAKAPASQVKLGFGEAPKSQMYVFCNRKHGGIWYHLDDQSQPVPINDTALTGYIRKLEFKEVVRRNEKSHKLHLYVEGDRTYVLESSTTSQFSKGVLSALAMATPEQFKRPLTLAPQASTESAEVLFCNIYDGDQQIFAPYDEVTDFKVVSRTAMNNVNLANGGNSTTAAQ